MKRSNTDCIMQAKQKAITFVHNKIFIYHKIVMGDAMTHDNKCINHERQGMSVRVSPKIYTSITMPTG